LPTLWALVAIVMSYWQAERSSSKEAKKEEEKEVTPFVFRFLHIYYPKVSHTSSFSLVELIKKDLNLEEEVKELEDVFEQDELNDRLKKLLKIII
jgi:hypothetical protein